MKCCKTCIINFVVYRLFIINYNLISNVSVFSWFFKLLSTLAIVLCGALLAGVHC